MLNVVLAQSDLEFFVWSTSSLMSFKAEKRLKETESKRKYRNKVKTNSQTTPH
jgi:hypothetical protein